MLMRVTLCLLAAVSCAPPDPESRFVLEVRGAVTVAALGEAVGGPVGDVVEPYYAIALGGPDGEAAAVFTRFGLAAPPVGSYPVGENQLGNGGFSGLVITGNPVHPSGVFRLQSGTLTITAATTAELVGRFDVQGRGFLTQSPDLEDKSVVADGHFSASIHP